MTQTRRDGDAQTHTRRVSALIHHFPLPSTKAVGSNHDGNLQFRFLAFSKALCNIKQQSKKI
jgi:hypothetical protein